MRRSAALRPRRNVGRRVHTALPGRISHHPFLALGRLTEQPFPTGGGLYECYIAFILPNVGRKPKTADGEQVYNRILAAREQRGLSRQDFAAAIGVHYQTVGYLERGEYSPSLVLALRIARVLDVHVEELFSLDPLPVPDPPATPHP